MELHPYTCMEVLDYSNDGITDLCSEAFSTPEMFSPEDNKKSQIPISNACDSIFKSNISNGETDKSLALERDDIQPLLVSSTLKSRHSSKDLHKPFVIANDRSPDFVGVVKQANLGSLCSGSEKDLSCSTYTSSEDSSPEVSKKSYDMKEREIFFELPPPSSYHILSNVDGSLDSNEISSPNKKIRKKCREKKFSFRKLGDTTSFTESNTDIKKGYYLSSFSESSSQKNHPSHEYLTKSDSLSDCDSITEESSSCSESTTLLKVSLKIPRRSKKSQLKSSCDSCDSAGNNVLDKSEKQCQQVLANKPENDSEIKAINCVSLDKESCDAQQVKKCTVCKSKVGIEFVCECYTYTNRESCKNYPLFSSSNENVCDDCCFPSSVRDKNLFLSHEEAIDPMIKCESAVEEKLINFDTEFKQTMADSNDSILPPGGNKNPFLCNLNEIKNVKNLDSEITFKNSSENYSVNVEDDIFCDSSVNHELPCSIPACECNHPSQISQNSCSSNDQNILNADFTFQKPNLSSHLLPEQINTRDLDDIKRKINNFDETDLSFQSPNLNNTKNVIENNSYETLNSDEMPVRCDNMASGTVNCTSSTISDTTEETQVNDFDLPIVGRFKNLQVGKEKLIKSSSESDELSPESIDVILINYEDEDQDGHIGSELLTHLRKFSIESEACEENVTSEEPDIENEQKLRVKRSSSLKCAKTPPDTPGRKKIVRFADCLGLDLAAIRTFLEGVPNVPASAFCDLEVDIDCDIPTTQIPTCKSYSAAASAAAAVLQNHANRILMPMFQQPGALPDFISRLREQKVLLENVTVGSDLSVKGIVRVVNEAFQKTVHVRYTFDNWRNFHEASASYIDTSGDGFSDRFSFLLWGSFLQTNGSLIFCVKYLVNGQEYWDNNHGSNYILSCYSSAPANIEREGMFISTANALHGKPQNMGSLTENSSVKLNVQSTPFINNSPPTDPWCSKFF